MNPTSRKPAFRDTVSVSGWLFADLLLALALVFLVSAPGTYEEPPTAVLAPTATPSPHYVFSATPTYMASATPTLTFTPTEIIHVGLAPPQCYNIYLDSATIDPGLIVQDLVDGIPNSPDYRAGLVLVWSHGSYVNEGVAMSRQVGTILRANFPLSFGEAQMKSLNFTVGQEYFVQLEVYFYADSTWQSGLEAPCSYTH